MKHLSIGSRWNADLVERYHALWSKDAASVDAEWRAFFEGFELASTQPKPATGTATAGTGEADGQSTLLQAIHAYRAYGHLQANVNPLAATPGHPELTDKALGLDALPADRVLHTGDFLGGQKLQVRQVLERLRETYCGAIGAEFMHIQDGERRRWLQQRIESSGLKPAYDKATKSRLISSVVRAEQFERFVHRTFVGAKRFSVEGGESMMPALEQVVERAPSLGVSEIVIGMAHRGRLNVLINTCGKKAESLFKEFSELHIPDTTTGDGDVKYHLGYENERVTSAGGKVNVVLAYNPSHLEAVNPVVLGRARARLDRRGDTTKRQSALTVLIHGDSAMAGQGIVSETFNLSGLKGYRVGGTLHLVVNNQIGFTTEPDESRTGRYCTEIAKSVEAPVFHVNGDAPESVVLATEIALEYRARFGADAVVDIICFRKHGHNETDEPLFTQPTLYRQIASHPTLSDIYGARLAAEGSLSAEELNALRAGSEASLSVAQEKAQAALAEDQAKRGGKAPGVRPFQSPYVFEAGTAVSAETLAKVAPALWTVPAGFAPNPKIKRQLVAKAEAFKSGVNFDWSLGEGLAFATLLAEGHPIRISGQDSERATFSHRHAVLHDPETGAEDTPLSRAGKGTFEVVNSSLSEYAVLGFDYGYSLDRPGALTIWEAQFGDFANGAQIAIDQFIASAESKWRQTSNLTMLLPHGYEGQGPEHSSARLERFLQLCAENNLQVTYPSTPAQLFHALRRQVKREVRKPAVVMTPKSLLRNKACVSALADFTTGGFREFLADPAAPAKTERLVLCTGKVYYDLAEARAARKDTATALVRAEQLYPINRDLLRSLWEKLGKPSKVVWCQEEPRNMGAWSFISPVIEEVLGVRPVYAGRDAAASPAVGSLAIHKIEQADLLEQAFRA
ncbi:MAG: 2-oxoglutarate dehydrogenase E1 component [Opitutales bacterium]